MITVKELRDALYHYDDESEVIIPLDTMDGTFASLKEIKYIRRYSKVNDEFEAVGGEVVLLP